MKRRIYRPSPEVPAGFDPSTAPTEPAVVPPRPAPRSAPVVRWPVISSPTGLVLAAASFALAMLATPPPGETAAAGLAGLARLVLYGFSGAVLAASSPSPFPLARPARIGAAQRAGATRDKGLRDAGGPIAETEIPPARRRLRRRLGPPVVPAPAEVAPAPGMSGAPVTKATHERWRSEIVLLVGLVVAVAVALGNVMRLGQRLDDPLGPVLWLASMLLVGVAVLIPPVWRLRWPPRWPGGNPAAGIGRRARWYLLAAILVFAAAVRFPVLGSIPIGIQADEGDRAYWALRVLQGLGPSSWFAPGWYFINMVYFRLLAVAMTIFGTSVGGTRAMSALVGFAFVAVVAWIGCRQLSWRAGLVAAALAATGALYVQQSRFIGESGVTALLWALSLAGLLEGGRSGRSWAFALAGLAGGLSLYFYPSGRLWVVGAAASFAVFWWFERGAWRGIAHGTVVAGMVSLIGVTPYLVHLEQNPEELTLRYVDTSVLIERNQIRLPYLNPPVSTPELLVLQVERTLGMFDRYADGVSFLPTERPAMPRPLGGLTIVGIAYVALRARRDPRLALLQVWFWLGMAGVLLTVETPDFLRAAGALVTFPFFAALALLDGADRLTHARAWLNRRTNGAGDDGRAAARRRVAIPEVGILGAFVALMMAYETYLYFVVYPPIEAPRWSYATKEGLQVARLGQAGPVYSIEMFEHHINSGWVHFLAQDASIGLIGNPGAQLPLLATWPASPEDADAPLPLPPAGRGIGVLVYPDPNQTPYLGMLQSLYPGGTVQPPIDGRQAFVAPTSLIDRTRGVTARAEVGGPGVVVPTFGTVPPGIALPATIQWQGGIRLPTSGRYAFRVSASRSARLSVDDVDVATTEGGAPVVVSFQAPRGVHFVRLTATIAAPGEQVSLAGTGPIASGTASPTFSELRPDQTFAPMGAPWGLLGQVSPGGRVPSPQTAMPSETFLDSTVAAAFLDRYVPLGSRPASVTWSGSLLAPRTGSYRLAVVSDGVPVVRLDGQPANVVVAKPESWQPQSGGAAIQLSAGAHAIQLTLTLNDGGRSVVRLVWIPPKPDGQVDPSGNWSVVPPSALRPATPIWDVQVATR